MFTSIIDGLLASPTVVCLSLAYGLLYSLMGIMDLAVGVRFCAAAYAGLLVASPKLDPVNSPGVWAAAIVGSVVASAVIWVALGSLRRAPPLATLVGSLGLAYVWEALFQVGFGSSPRTFGGYPVEVGFAIAGTTATRLELVRLAYATLAVASVWLLLRSTRLGQQLVAVSVDPEVARTVFGLSPTRLTWITVLLVGVLLGPIGLLHGIRYGVSPTTGVSQGLLAFVAAVTAGRHRPVATAMLGLALVCFSTLAIAWPVGQLLVALVAFVGFARLSRSLQRNTRTIVALCGGVLTAGLVGGHLPQLLGGVRLPSAFQPLAPYLVVLCLLLWRPSGALSQAPTRGV